MDSSENFNLQILFHNKPSSLETLQIADALWFVLEKNNAMQKEGNQQADFNWLIECGDTMNSAVKIKTEIITALSSFNGLIKCLSFCNT